MEVQRARNSQQEAGRRRFTTLHSVAQRCPTVPDGAAPAAARSTTRYNRL
jgi:hypothetical protein